MTAAERSVQMRLYTMHKREFVVVFLVFFACLCLCLFVGLAGPPITSTVVRTASELTPPGENVTSVNMATGPFVLKTPPLTAYSQQLWVIAQISMKEEDDPVFPMSLLVNSWVPGMLDAMFQATFLCALLLFWLCVYHGIRQNERHLATFYLPKLFVVGMLWTSAFVLASWQRYNELRDPTYNYKVDTQAFAGLKIFFFTMGSIYLVYLLYLVVQAYTELRSMPYFDVRLKFMTSLMLIVLTLSVVITVMRFGISVLEDNFVADLSTSYGSSAEFMSFYGLLNFYLYTMAYVYTPPPNAFLEPHIKDNPTLSMMNDSDEEVIYGSDTEERLLNPVRLGQDKEESD
ncbi:hypothetical protein HPB47_004723 [Ixodes persulcatus]|uniref:Uncharacterized protein n=1 Tax=Ixodes persulcatus TaxID=34615 RepID=A0AC60PEU4_IXOPE|nr:hypothetical protein HPB47_004723 [Ixodes persulcatus]